MTNPSASDGPKTAAGRLEGLFGLDYQQWEKVIETVAAIILSLAALATSWSGYQAGRWSGVMATNFNQAGALRTESVRSSNTAAEQAQVDIQLFTSWLEAFARDEPDLADFYRVRFRSEFVPAFEAWLASEPRSNPAALPSPFLQPEYQLAASVEADRLETEAAATFQAGTVANQTGDNYVFNAVLLALALFFAGMAGRFVWLPVRAVLLGTALVMVLIGLSNLIRYPIH